MELLPIDATRIVDVPGVGARLAQKLIEYFGDPAHALRAIKYCRLGLLEQAVGKAAAHRLLHNIYRGFLGCSPREVAATDEAWELYTSARKLLEEYAATPAGRDIIACSLPVTRTSWHVIEARRAVFAQAQLFRDIAKALESVGSEITWPQPPRGLRLNRLLVIVGDRAGYEHAKKEFKDVVKVVYIDDPRDVETVAEGYNDVIVYDPYGVYTGRYPVIERLALIDVAPEIYVERVRASWRVLKAIAYLAENIGSARLAELAKTYGYSVDIEDIKRIVKASRLLRGGDVNEEFDPDYARLKRALARLDTVIDDVEVWVNERIRREVEKLEVRIPAAKLLELLASLQKGEPPPSLELPDEIVELLTRVGEEAVERIVEELGLDEDEALLAKNLVPETPLYPFTVNREAVNDLRESLAVKLAAKRLEVMRKMAELVRGVDKALDDIVQALALLDAGSSMVRLREQGVPTTIPEVLSEPGIGFINATEASLARRIVGKQDNVQPVTYFVGSVSVPENPTRGERVVLLTGANSGGKTTLIKTVAEIVLMGQAGLPVYARKAWHSVFERVFFVSKPQGEVGAGALEAMISLLAEAATGKGPSLILVDELEAATEAGAAAKILAGFIEYLVKRGDTIAVIVSHLVDSVLSSLSATVKEQVRVDGIEAQGLDENYNLIVDRNPKFYHYARSTPELVLIKLTHTSRKRSEREFYSQLLSKLREH